MIVSTYTKTGHKATTAVKLNKAVFGVSPKNHELLKQAYVAYLANGRTNLAVTKKRGQVSGGGRKPWRQKGTGRARAGSSRSPLWRGGGITFGPTGQENFSKSLSVATKRQAVRQALSLAAGENRISVIEAFECQDGKTSKAVQLLSKIGASGNVLLVVGSKNDLPERATRNLVDVKAVPANCLNVFDVLNADSIIISQAGLEIIHDWLGVKK
jgi:large subunit ribosomal protein L4